MVDLINKLIKTEQTFLQKGFHFYQVKRNEYIKGDIF